MYIRGPQSMRITPVNLCKTVANTVYKMLVIQPEKEAQMASSKFIYKILLLWIIFFDGNNQTNCVLSMISLNFDKQDEFAQGQNLIC